MTFLLKRTQLSRLFVCALVVYLLPVTVLAQQTQQLSVSPTLFEMSATPGQVWNSSIKIVNANSFPLEVSVTVTDFAPQGEDGAGRFIEIAADGDNQTLAEWISYDTAPITLPPESAVDVPFSVTLPAGASPGGHFAAFLVGTVPVSGDSGESKLRTSQVVTSLLFARVAGDVVENGGIREFSTAENFYQSPAASFNIRFENTGNVHLRPQGSIEITNMWGQARGTLPLNPQNSFGNVLPDSIRNYIIGWRGELSAADIGRYKAVVTLAYGTDKRQFATATTYFWVVPLVPLLSVIFGMALFLFMSVWLVRRYVKHILIQAGVSPHGYHKSPARSFKRVHDLTLVDSKAQVDNSRIVVDSTLLRLVRSGQLVVVYLTRKFKLLLEIIQMRPRTTIVLVFVILVMLIGGAILLIMQSKERSFEVVYIKPEGNTTVSSDQIIYDNQTADADAHTARASTSSSVVQVLIVNESGVAGLGATVAVLAKSAGFDVTEIQTKLDAELGRTRIVTRSETTEDALRLSGLLDNALISTAQSGTSTAAITIYVGKDLASAQ